MQAPGWAILQRRRGVCHSIECLPAGWVSVRGAGKGFPGDGSNRIWSGTQPGHGFAGARVETALLLVRPRARNGASNPGAFREPYRVEGQRYRDRSAEVRGPLRPYARSPPITELAVRTGAISC